MDLIEVLNQVGFTEYEAKVYLALLRDHPASGYQLSKVSGVPRSMVYETLSRLSSRGAVLASEGKKSTLYKPLPPEVLLRSLKVEHEEHMSVLSKGLAAAYTSHPEERLWTINGREAVLAYAGEMISHAEEEVLLVLPDEALESLSPLLHTACDRDLSVRVLLTGEGTLACGEVAYHPPLESELQELTHTLVVVSDDSQSLISNMDVEVSATATTNRKIVAITRQFIWMEMFTQRIATRLGDELLDRLPAEDRAVFKSLSTTLERSKTS
ncbi:MAG: helix-turn-helix domain-containing protein [Anaerolineales bacterium]|jgi:Cd2+/Zn2+-exporting ATPase